MYFINIQLNYKSLLYFTFWGFFAKSLATPILNEWGVYFFVLEHKIVKYFTMFDENYYLEK